MDLAHPATLLLPAGVAVLVSWRVYSRVKRMVGRQRLSKVRPWITVIVFPVVVGLLLAGSLGHPESALGLAGGALFGCLLGWYGLRVTKFEPSTEGFFYTPNAHLGIALSLLFVGRLAYRGVQLYWLPGSLPAGASDFARSPLTLLIFGTLAGYYVAYAIGLLRWRRRVALANSDDPSGEHRV
jgi:hypothetical protein